MIRIPALSAALLLLAACAYEAPLNPNADVDGNVIAGEIVANGVEDPGPVVIFVTDFENQMPPYGTGKPVTFATVAPSAFTGEGTTLQSAPWSVTGVPDGTYAITALMDMDGDFHPFAFRAAYEGSSGPLAGATCGDVVGAHLADLSTSEIGSATVSGGTFLDDVTVVIGSEVPFERPAFQLEGGALITRIDKAAAAADDSQFYALETIPVHHKFLQPDGTVAVDDDGEPFEVHLEGPYDGGADTCQTAFLVTVRDEDGDGRADPHPDYGEPLYDISLSGGLVYMGQPVDADGDGIAESFTHDLEPGESWKAPAVVSPRMVLFNQVQVGTQLVTEVELVWLPAALHVLPDGTEEIVTDVEQIPSGAWSLTVIAETGQTWTVPSKLWQHPSLDEASYDPLTQAGYLLVE